MRTATGPWAAIVTQEICPGCLPPILSASIRLGYESQSVGLPIRLRYGSLELWTAADDNLIRGAWIRIDVDRSVAVDRGQEGQFLFLSSSSEAVNESTVAAFAPRLVKTFLNDNKTAIKISAGYGGVTVLEMWGVEDVESPTLPPFNSSFFAEIGCEPAYWSDTTRVGALVTVENSSPLARDWKGATFAFDVPTNHIMSAGASSVATLRQAMRFTPGVVPPLPTGLTSLPARAVGELTAAVDTGKTSAFRVTGPELADRCAIPDGPFWHEQAIVRSGPLAVFGMLHKITAEFSSRFTFASSHPEVFGSWVESVGGGFLTQQGFRHGAIGTTPRVRMAYIDGQQIEFLPFSQEKRLLPRNYWSGPVSGPMVTFTQINNNGILGPADYDVQPVIHAWLQTPLDLNTNIANTIRIFFTFQMFLIWRIRATTGGWTGNRRYSRAYPAELRSARLTFAECDSLAAGGSVEKELRFFQGSTEFSDNSLDGTAGNPPTVRLSLSEYVP